MSQPSDAGVDIRSQHPDGAQAALQDSFGLDRVNETGEVVARRASSGVADAGENYPFLSPPRGPGEVGWLGQYRVLGLLGKGGMALVFRAEDTHLQRPVALKVMKPDIAEDLSFRQRFLREARATAALKSDHVVTIHQVGQADGVPFLAMELLEGESLDDRLRREGRVHLAEVLRLGRETATGLQAARERGLIHRDIKPANLWLEAPRGRVKVLDFGLAIPQVDNLHLTEKGVIVGTPAYMAPEQARGDSLDPRTDLFSLGCVLFRLYTGMLPFVGETTMALLAALITDTPPSLRKINPGVPPALADLVDRLLAKEPDRRPRSAREVVAALQAIERDLPAPAVAPSAFVPPVILSPESKRMPTQTFTPRGPAPFSLSACPTRAAAQRPPSRGRKALGMVLLVVGFLLFAAGTALLFHISKGTVATVADAPEVSRATLTDAPKVPVKEGGVLSPNEQIEAVAKDLRALNPTFHGTFAATVEQGTVARLDLEAAEVTNLSPLRAFAGLRRLDLVGAQPREKPLDLSPLKGLPLRYLHLGRTTVTSLAPLQDMPLEHLLSHGGVSDLSPLRMKTLRWLDLSLCPVADVKALAGLPLAGLNLAGTAVEDLSPLRGMPLQELLLSPLVKDLSPLKGMKLSWLNYSDAVQDISVLKDMPLRHIECPFRRARDEEVFRSIPTLDNINGKQPEVFWKEIDASKPSK